MINKRNYFKANSRSISTDSQLCPCNSCWSKVHFLFASTLWCNTIEHDVCEHISHKQAQTARQTLYSAKACVTRMREYRKPEVFIFQPSENK